MNYRELLLSPLFPSQIALLVQKASQSHAAVLIEGERGTEKDLLAKIVHHLGEWTGRRFCKLDCKLLSETALFEQLSGLSKEAEDGTSPVTVYLKNVDYLGRESQLSLLERVEDGIFQTESQKGEIKPLRYISSSTSPLREKVGEGTFSEDLYDRLDVLSIQIAPLRDRVREIPAIAQYILTEQRERMKIRKVQISPQVLRLLQAYRWPGNVRELERVVLRSAVFSEGENLTEKDLSFFDAEEGSDDFGAFLRRSSTASALESKGDHFLDKRKSALWSLFLVELIHRIKNPLVSIKTFTQVLQEKFDDVEFRDHFYHVVSEDIEKIDFVLNTLLSYIRVNSPASKINTVHDLLEETLKKHGDEIEKKNIKILKRFEKDLPETTLHDEQLRYVFSSILQYVIPSLSPGGSIELSTKSCQAQERSGHPCSPEEDGKWIEVSIAYTGLKKSTEHFEAILGFPPVQEGEPIELELRLVKEMIERYHGMMKFEVNAMKPRTLISLTLPLERRKLIYYQPSNP